MGQFTGSIEGANIPRQKAKAENKFYSVMREKEAGESEKKAMIRQLEKQGKAVERALEVEKNLSSQVVSDMC